MKTHGILNLIAVSVIAMTVETASAAGPAVARSSVLVPTDAGPVKVSSFSPGSLRITRGEAPERPGAAARKAQALSPAAGEGRGG